MRKEEQKGRQAGRQAHEQSEAYDTRQATTERRSRKSERRRPGGPRRDGEGKREKEETRKKDKKEEKRTQRATNLASGQDGVHHGEGQLKKARQVDVRPWAKLCALGQKVAAWMTRKRRTLSDGRAHLGLQPSTHSQAKVSDSNDDEGF